MTAGMFLMGAGMLIYAVVGGDANLALIEVAFVIVGIGLALNTGPVVGVAVSAVSAERAGLASGIANLARMFGATLGVAVQGTVLAAISHDVTHGPAFLSGLRTALLVGCVVELLGAAIALIKVRNPGKVSLVQPGGGPESESARAQSHIGNRPMPHYPERFLHPREPQ
jgi:MFS family permease